MAPAPGTLRVAVVGHVEWVTFLPIDHALTPGVIAHARGGWDEAAGGGGVAAAEVARLAGRATLFTTLGADANGRAAASQLAGLGVEVHADATPEQPRAITLIDPAGERTIVVVGAASGPGVLAPDALAGFDAVYFCKGDAAALRAARRARVLVATARILPVLREAGVVLDALVLSARDAGERYVDGDLDPAPRLVCTTDGAAGGAFRCADGRAGRWAAAPVPPGRGDAYGAGDSFAAGLTYALACGLGVDAACAHAALSGAAANARRGAHGRFAPA
jgi:ribokinase